MELVEFQVTVRNGIIEIPEVHQADIQDAEIVKVVVVKKARKRRQIVEQGFLAQLAREPVEITGFLTREEAHDRQL